MCVVFVFLFLFYGRRHSRSSCVGSYVLLGQNECEMAGQVLSEKMDDSLRLLFCEVEDVE